MYDLIQTLQVLTPEEVKFVNSELDKKHFTVSSIGFADGDTGEPRVDSNVRSSSGCYLLDEEEVSKVIHKGMNNKTMKHKKASRRLTTYTPPQGPTEPKNTKLNNFDWFLPFLGLLDLGWCIER